MIRYSDEFKQEIMEYYKMMYSWVGLKNIDLKIADRLNEDAKELARCNRLENILGIKMADYEKHLVVGAGTGGMIVALKQKDVKKVVAVEPYKKALLIARGKAKLAGVHPENISQDVVEALPYADCSIDMIHCFTVLEHVKVVRKAIKEMYRVLKPGGLIYINTPDYRFPYEGHYKLPLPVFMKRTITKLCLKLLKRPTRFINTIQFVTEKNLDNILRTEVALYWRIYEKVPNDWFYQKGNSWKYRMLKWVYRFFYLKMAIPKNQEIIIKKL